MTEMASAREDANPMLSRVRTSQAMEDEVAHGTAPVKDDHLFRFFAKVAWQAAPTAIAAEPAAPPALQLALNAALALGYGDRTLLSAHDEWRSMHSQFLRNQRHRPFWRILDRLL